jgi:SAM-dependent MidA family methyltransferase
VPIPDSSLPVPDAAALAHSANVAAAVRASIAANGGWLPFDAYMQLVLYAPGLGYYVAGARKFGAAGDFVTAPELTPLFAGSLAVQLGAIRERSGGDVLELGAGTGRLAADLLPSLEASAPGAWRYRIVEPSPELRDRQQATIERDAAPFATRVEWIDSMPEHIDGVILMNEVLDAIPVHVVVRRGADWFERGVIDGLSGFAFEDRALGEGSLRRLAEARFPSGADYESELNPAAEALIEDLGRRLRSGAILVIDYGFPRHEYFHPQRTTGTLIGHYRHRTHADPFLWPGLSDLTAHVDFTAIAEAGVRAGLEVAGFTTQAAFLLGCGLLDRLQEIGAPESRNYLCEASAVQKLLSPAEMGELFKVIALARSGDIAWPAFAMADMRRRL